MKSLENEQDVQSTREAMEQPTSWFLGKIPDQKTPWYFINLKYADGWVHWYDAGGGNRRAVCAGGLAKKGWAPDECPVCAYVLELYQEAKRLAEEGDEAKAKQLKERGNRLHAGAEVQFKIIRGQRTLLKTKAGKEWIADWDTEDDDSTVDIGIISFTSAQWEGLMSMVKGEETPFIEHSRDLGKRILWTSKERRKGKGGTKYSAVVWSADEEESETPDIEIPQELLEIDLSENFVVDMDEIHKVAALISGQEVEEIEEDEEVELEEDSEQEPTDADLDDLDEDEDYDEDEASGEEKGEEEEEVVVDDDDFEDDIPYEEEEPKPSKKKKTVVKKSTVRKKAAPAKKTPAKKSAPRSKARAKSSQKVSRSTSTGKSKTRRSGKARL
jgi:hypothetical protein